VRLNNIFKNSGAQKTQFVSAAKTDRLMLLEEVAAVYCDSRRNKVYSVNRVKGFSVLTGGADSYHCA
jgi:hypothetical protein